MVKLYRSIASLRIIASVASVAFLLAACDGGPDDAPLAADEAALVACAVVPPCDAPAPVLPAARSFRNFGSWVLSSLNQGAIKHRGRDQLVVAGAPQWILGRIAYGGIESALTDEDVDVHVLRGCGTTWEKLDTVRTTTGEHAAVEGVADNGGRVYYQIPAAKVLGLGRHRVRLVVAGDGSATELFVEVVAPGTKVFVSDVDGTLTISELEEIFANLFGRLPEANTDAARELEQLVALGYRPFYLTARAEALTDRTRAFLAARGFPAGTVHTSLDGVGLSGAPAAAFKTGEIVQLGGKGLLPSLGFGNTDTDAQAYEAGGIAPASRRLYYRFTDAAHGGTRFESYAELDGTLAALPPACQ